MARLARGLGTLFALQLFTRLLSFAVNAFLARSLGPAWYAFANVQLHLVASTALFLPKEGLRRAAQRIYPGGEGSPLAWGMNVAWLSVPVAALVAVLLVAGAAARSGADGEWEELMGRSEARATLLLAAVAAVVEAACEPGWVYAQANLLLPQRALAEGAALVAKALTACALVVHAVNARRAANGDPMSDGSRAGNPRGLGLAFGLSQLAYSVSFFALLYALTAPRAPSRSPAPHRSQRDATKRDTHRGRTSTADTDGSPPAPGSSAGGVCWLPRHVWVLTAQSVAQAAQKYVLTEGERLVVVATSPIESQGVYALVTNLSSLAARILLQPLEEMTYTHFSRAAAARAVATVTSACPAAPPPAAAAAPPTAPPHAATATPASAVTAATATPADDVTSASRQLELQRVHSLLRASCIFGLIILSLGPPYAWLLLRLVYGPAWAAGGAPALLATYCAHVCGMAVNGVSEAYVQAAASPAERATVAAATTAVAVGYAGAAAVGVQCLGVHGLVLANALNMAARTCISYRVVRAPARAARLKPAPRLAPHPAVLGALAAAAVAAHVSARWLGSPAAPATGHAAHVAVGAGGLLAVAAAVAVAEPELAEGGRAMWGSRRAGADTGLEEKKHRA